MATADSTSGTISLDAVREAEGLIEWAQCLAKSTDRIAIQIVANSGDDEDTAALAVAVRTMAIECDSRIERALKVMMAARQTGEVAHG